MWIHNATQPTLSQVEDTQNNQCLNLVSMINSLPQTSLPQTSLPQTSLPQTSLPQNVYVDKQTR